MGTRIERRNMIGLEKITQRPSLNDIKGLTNIRKCPDRSLKSKRRMRESMLSEIRDFKVTFVIFNILMYFISSTKL